MKKKATIICDMQFGSTGKGLLAGYLAERDQPDVLVTAWSLNAGHSYIDASGRKFVHCMLANGIVSPKARYVLIAPGSQIGVDRLLAEMHECRDIIERQGIQVIIHENACVIQDRHIAEESGTMTAIGSTKKGCGAALAEKIQRNPQALTTAGHLQAEILLKASALNLLRHISIVGNKVYARILDEAERVQVEGAQGYSLGINSGFYPYTTSRECTPAQIASDCLIPLAMIGKVVGTMRTYPIRVANRYDEDGNQIGWSGPCYPDQDEITFGEIGQEVEHTTVTKLPRRIFTFSPMQCREAMRAVMPDEVFLNFANYTDYPKLLDIVAHISDAANKYGCGGVTYLGYGPTAEDVYETSIPEDDRHA